MKLIEPVRTKVPPVFVNLFESDVREIVSVAEMAAVSVLVGEKRVLELLPVVVQDKPSTEGDDVRDFA